MKLLLELLVPLTPFKMIEEETTVKFNVCLCDIYINSFALYEKMLEEKLVKKILRYLLKMLYMKVTSIEEELDVSTMKVDEFFESLLTLEMDIDDKCDKKSKGVAFKVNTTNHGDQVSNATNEILMNLLICLIIILARLWENLIGYMGIISLQMSNEINKIIQEMVTFSVEEEIVKDKTLDILTDLKESNVMDVQDLGISEPSILILWENKEKVTMPPFRIMSLTKEVNPIRQVALWHLLLAWDLLHWVT